MLSTGTKQLFYCFLSCDGVYEVFTPDQIDDVVRTLLNGKHVNNNATDEIVINAALCLFNGQTDQAIGLIRAWKGRDINCV